MHPAGAAADPSIDGPRRGHSHGRVPVAVGAMFAVTLLIRLGYLLVARPSFEGPYWDLSGSLLTDGSLAFDGVRTTAFEPLYPLFIALSRVLVGDRELLVQTIQCLVASLGAVFLYRLGTALTGRLQAGLVAGLLYAAYPLLVRHSVDATDSALMTTLMIAFAAEFAAAPRPGRAARAGIWLGLAVLTRATALPVVALAGALRWRTDGWRPAASLAVACLLVLAPYSIRNYILNGTLLPTRSGLNLFISNSKHTATVFPDHGPDALGEYVELVRDREMPGDMPPSPELEGEQDRMWTRRALEEIRQNPGRTLALKAKNVLLFFSPRLVPYYEPTEETRLRFGGDGTVSVVNAQPRPLRNQILFTLSYMPVLALAATGVWLRRASLDRDGILWCILGTFVVVHAVYFPTTRYRVPAEFIFLFYAAVALDRGIGALEVVHERGFNRGVSL